MTTLKQLWTLRSLAKMSDDEFRNLCYSFSQKESTKDLTPNQRDQVKKKILQMYPQLKVSPSKQISRKRSLTKKTDKVFVLPSALQKDHAKALLDTLLKIGPSGITLDTQSIRMYKKSFQKLSRFEVQGVIESLKGMIKRYQLASSSPSDSSNS